MKNMENLFVVLSILCLLAILAGLVEPTYVVRWGEAKTRKNVIRYYGFGAWLMLTFGMGLSKEISFTQAFTVTSMLACLTGFIIGMVSPTTVIVWGPKEERNRKKVCLYYGLGFLGAMILGMLAAVTEDNFQWLGGLGRVVLVITLIVGMINPENLPTLRPLEERNRKNVLKYYGIGLLIACLIPWEPAATQTIVEPTTQVTQNVTTQKVQNAAELQGNNIAVTDEIKPDSNAEATANKAEANDETIATGDTVTSSEQENNKEEAPVDKKAENSIEGDKKQVQEETNTLAEETKTEAKVEEVAPVKEEIVTNSSSASNERTVYWVPSGEVYHTSRNCSSLSRSKTILSGTISESGKPRKCKRC